MTRAEQVRQQLAAEIAAGVLPPGTRLDEIEQSMRLGVSRTPLREALRELTALGLVRGAAHRGVTVCEGVNPYMSDALAELETLCGCRAAVRMSGRDRATLRKLAVERGDWLEMIHASVDNPVLVRFAQTLWQPLLGMEGASRFATDDIHPLGMRLAEAVAANASGDIEAAAHSYIKACVGLVFGRP